VDHPVAVKGFQAEITPRGRGIGGLYETLGRAWVVRADGDTVADVFKEEDWNTMEVRAVGGDITVRLNGAKVAELTDDPGLPAGHIALQLHGNGHMDVRFRRIEMREMDR
jgi:hypothetical protein